MGRNTHKHKMRYKSITRQYCGDSNDFESLSESRPRKIGDSRMLEKELRRNYELPGYCRIECILLGWIALTFSSAGLTT